MPRLSKRRRVSDNQAGGGAEAGAEAEAANSLAALSAAVTATAHSVEATSEKQEEDTIETMPPSEGTSAPVDLAPPSAAEKAEASFDPEFPFACEKCSKKYRKIGFLNRHLATAHGEPTEKDLTPEYEVPVDPASGRFTCFECPAGTRKLYKQKSGFFYHLRHVHKKDDRGKPVEDQVWTCDECGKKLKSRPGYDYHKTTSCPTVKKAKVQKQAAQATTPLVQVTDTSEASNPKRRAARKALTTLAVTVSETPDVPGDDDFNLSDAAEDEQEEDEDVADIDEDDEDITELLEESKQVSEAGSESVPRKRKKGGSQRSELHFRKDFSTLFPKSMDELRTAFKPVQEPAEPIHTTMQSTLETSSITMALEPAIASVSLSTPSQGAAEIPAHTSHLVASEQLDCLAINAGAPVGLIDWCPCAEDDEFVFIAIAASHLYPTHNIRKHFSGYLQIWRCKLGDDQCAQLAYSIQHDGGLITTLAWCPSITRNKNRMGILAAASTDSQVRLYSIPNPSQVYAKHQTTQADMPCIDLPPSRILQALWHPILCMDWSCGPQHRYILGGTASGTLCMWDLREEAPQEPFSQEPVRRFGLEEGPLRVLACCPTDERLVATAGQDISIKIWHIDAKEQAAVVLIELQTPPSPFRFNKSDMCWSLQYSGIFYTALHDRSKVLTFGTENVKANIAACADAPVWSVHCSAKLGCIAIGSEDGTVRGIVLPLDGEEIPPLNVEDRGDFTALCLFRPEDHDAAAHPHRYVVDTEIPSWEKEHRKGMLLFRPKRKNKALQPELVGGDSLTFGQVRFCPSQNSVMAASSYSGLVFIQDLTAHATEGLKAVQQHQRDEES